MDQSLTLIVAVATTFFLAGIVKGVAGMGLPTVAMGVLGALLSPLAAASLLLAPSFVTNVWQLFTGPNVGRMVARLWPMMIGIIIGTVAGSALLTGGDTRVTTTALGLALVAYAAFTLLARPFRVPETWEPVAGPVVGLATGLVTGATGVFVIPAVPYLQSLNLDKEHLIQALGLSFTVSTVALAIGLGWHGGAPTGNWLASLLAIFPALLGMAVGQILRTKISPVVFRRVFLVSLLILGVEMALRTML